MSAEHLSRRRLLKRLMLGGAALIVARQTGLFSAAARWLDPVRSVVAAARCPDYSEEALARALETALSVAPIPLPSGRPVVLKPNFVDHFEGRPVETDARLILAVIRHLKRMGVREVIVAEGPGNRNDLAPVLSASGLAGGLAREGVRFVDLNYDDLVHLDAVVVEDMDSRSLLSRISLPRTLLDAGLVISLPKLKTHHHVGATLSMKNLFGCIPGAKYGWPKNLLHWNGIDRSVLEIYGTLRARVPMYAIVDAVIGMEGDGPLNGTARQVGLLLAGNDFAAVDAVAARVMGIDAVQIAHLGAAELTGLGRVADRRIALAGDPLVSVLPFELPPKFGHLRRPG